MEIIDLTHTIENDMPAYPGEESPVLENKYSHQNDGFQVLRLKMLTHSGTHLDTPAHFYDNGLTTDIMNLTNFYGKGLLIDCSGFSEGEIISAQSLLRYNEELQHADFALIYSGWSKHWGANKYFGKFPVLSEESTMYLLSFKLKGIGLDVISIDPISSAEYKNHNLVLSNGLIIIENLTNLEYLVNKTFDFAAFPLKIKHGDGSPVRATAIVK